MGDRIRAFVGLPMPEEVLPCLLALQGGLGVGRPVPEENLHLTLVFLGDVALDALDALHEGLMAIPVRPIRLRLAGLDLMGDGRVLALRAERDPALMELQKTVARISRAAGIDLERRRFRPHVTIARLPRPASPEIDAKVGRFLQGRGDASCPQAQIAEIALYRSHLKPSGAHHEILARYPDYGEEAHR